MSQKMGSQTRLRQLSRWAFDRSLVEFPASRSINRSRCANTGVYLKSGRFSLGLSITQLSSGLTLGSACVGSMKQSRGEDAERLKYIGLESVLTETDTIGVGGTLLLRTSGPSG